MTTAAEPLRQRAARERRKAQDRWSWAEDSTLPQGLDNQLRDTILDQLAENTEAGEKGPERTSRPTTEVVDLEVCCPATS